MNLDRITPHWRTIAILAAISAMVGATAGAQGDQTLDGLVRSYMAERGAEPQLAPDHQLCRRFAIDFTGVIPSVADLAACDGATPEEMYQHFVDKGPMPHTGGERPYVWVNLLKDSDHFLFSNSTQFSQVGHIREFRDRLRTVYADGGSYADFARWALDSQMFLNRFPSAADRANASFFLFLGRDSLSSEVPAGNMWNGWALRDDDIPASEAETNPDYHVYDYDPSRCRTGDALCSATLWGVEGDSPAQIIELMVGSTLFAEATVDRYWARFVGAPLPGVDYPELRAVLVRGFVERGHDVNWLIREITTSAVYTQEMMYR